MKTFLSSWKTTISGVIIAVLASLYVLGKIDLQTAFLVQAFFQSVGFIASTDADKLKKLK